MNSTLRKFIACLVMCLSAHLPTACLGEVPSEKLANRLNEIVKTSGFPGFAVAITNGNETIFSQGFGYSDKARKQPYTPQTIQPVGSVSKTFIGVAVMKAVEMNLISLDADINTYLPFKIQNPHRPQDKISLRHLATHTSGLLDNDATYLGTYTLDPVPAVPLGQFLQDYYAPNGKHYNKANFANGETGKAYAYSNIASALAAFIVERAAKMPFDKFTEQHIFVPLKMSVTHWFYRDDLGKQYATLYEVNKQELPLYQKLLNADNSLKTYSCVTYPDGGLRSSAADLVEYVKAMSQGYFGQAGILRPESFAALFKKQFDTTTMPANMSRKEPNTGIFWPHARNGTIRHTGSDAGVFAFISFHPQTKIGRVLTLNTQLDGDDNALAVKSFSEIIEALDKFEGSLK